MLLYLVFTVNLHYPHIFSLFFFNDTATTEIYTLSLHDALPILTITPTMDARATECQKTNRNIEPSFPTWLVAAVNQVGKDRKSTRLNSSHQIISYAVFCLKKKKRRRVVRVCTALLVDGEHAVLQ